MRELRTFELDDSGQPVSWRARHGQRVTAIDGLLWLTIEGQTADIWLRAGEGMALPEGAQVWLSGESPGARFQLSEAPAPLSVQRAAAIARQLLRRWNARKTDAFGDCPQVSA